MTIYLATAPMPWESEPDHLSGRPNPGVSYDDRTGFDHQISRGHIAKEACGRPEDHRAGPSQVANKLTADFRVADLQ